MKIFYPLLIAAAITMSLCAGAQTYVSGGFVEGTWTHANSPYVITGSVTVDTMASLRIEPGVKILFNGSYAFTVKGTLRAEGSETDTIFFSTPDTIAYWQGLRFSGTNTMDSSVVRYAIIEKGRATYGGGIAFTSSSNVLVDHCVIRNNRATRKGGGIYCYNSSPGIKNSEIAYNTCDRYTYSYGGGGMSVFSNAQPRLYRVNIHHNTCAYGGGIHIYLNSDLELDHCTVANNTTTNGYQYGGILIYYSYNDPVMRITNSIIWGNYGYELYNFSTSNGATIITHSDFQGGYAGEGNINTDPVFVDVASGNYQLSSSSPCVDAGNPLSPPDPDGTRADMGAIPTDRSGELNAWFTVDEHDGYAPLSVTFTDLSGGGGEVVQSWLWDFGDGTTSDQQHPQKTYTIPGNYDVTLIAYTPATSDTVTIPGLIRARSPGYIYPGNVQGVWENANSPYIIGGDITLPADTQLVIEPGVWVIFDGHHRFTVHGRLLADGAPGDSIRFVPADSTLGWKGLRFDHIDENGQDSCILDHCKVEYGKTTSSMNSPDYNGAGIYCYYSTKLRISHSIIAHNSAYYYGGGICFSTYSSAQIFNTDIHHNSARYGGGIAYNSNNRSSRLENVTIRNNSAITYGGGIYWNSSGTKNNFSRVLIAGNHASRGGGIYCYYNTGSNLDHVTIAGNTASAYGGGIYTQRFYINNSIVWSNSPQDIYYQGTTPNVYSNYSDINYNVSGTGNIRENPLFEDPASGNYHLQAGSPCIDAGNIDDPYDPDGTVSDMGMYYHHQSTLPFRALFTADSLDSRVPASVTFEDISTNGFADNTGWKWYFGDGDSSDHQHPVHVYEEIGTYSVTLIVTDSRGFRDTLTRADYIRVHDVEGTVSGIWRTLDSPINVTGNVIVPQYQHLTIEPDVEVRFWGEYNITVNGRLTAQGISGEPIEFTLEDTTGIYNGTHTTWNGLRFVSTGQDGQDSSRLNHCIFHHSKRALYFKSSSNVYVGHSAMRSNIGDNGAGILLDNSSPLLENCQVSDNHAANMAGGIYIQNGSAPTLKNLDIHMNISESTCGGLYVSHNADPHFENVRLRENSAMYGGGLVLDDNPDFKFEGLIIEGNIATYGGGFFYAGNEAVTLDGIFLESNRAALGGGIYLSGKDLNIVRGVFIKNRADTSGGGIYTEDGWLNLYESTFVENRADTAGGGLYKNSGTVKINSCIFWENTVDDVFSANGDIDVAYSNMQADWPGDGNINDDPKFVDQDHDDLRLQWDFYPVSSLEMSPCIDAGDPLLPINPDGSRADMGAFPFEQQDLKPKVLSVTDVPNDQGKQVQVVWQRSEYDVRNGYDPITRYSLWRFDMDPDDSTSWVKTFLNEMPARQEEKYSLNAATLYDSVESGINYTLFEVLAHTNDVWRFFASDPDSGYSIDNIAPMLPQGTKGVAGSKGITLAWNAPPDEDFAYTSLYRDGVLIDRLIDTIYQDTGLPAGTSYLYDIQHYDVNGNGSPLKSVQVQTLDWSIECLASAGLNHSMLVLGAHETGSSGLDPNLDLDAPPLPPSDYLVYYTYHPEWGSILGDRFRQDILQNAELGDQHLQWDMFLLSDQSTLSEVTFRFGDSLPRVPVLLVDDQYGSRRQISEDSTYSFSLTANIPYKLQLIIGDTVAPGINLIKPDGLEILKSREETTIEWQLTDAGPEDLTLVSISYDGGLSFQDLGNTTGTSLEVVPEYPLSNECRIRVRITDQSGNQESDMSDYWFSVVDTLLDCSLDAGWHLWSSQERINGPLSPQLDDDLSAPYYTFAWRDSLYVESDSISSGQGIWLGMVEKDSFDVSGAPVTEVFHRTYQQGWNMISNPFVRPISTDSLVIHHNAQILSFEDAVMNGWIAETVFGFAGNQYVESGSLELWKAYWLGVLADELSIEYKVHRNSGKKSGQIRSDYDWEVNIHHITVGGRLDSDLQLDPYDKPMPPPPPSADYLELYIKHPEWNFILGEKFKTDIRPVNTWNVTQEYPLGIKGSGNHDLTWSINNLPDEVDVYLDLGSRSYDLREETAVELSLDGQQDGMLRIGLNLVGVKSPHAPDPWHLYPNPVRNIVWVNTGESRLSDLVIELSDLLGRKMSAEQIIDKEDSRFGFDVSALPCGIYNITIRSGAERIVRKFVKQ